MSKETGWDKTLNAEKYEEYVSQFQMYQRTSRFLVETADITPGMHVLDIGCGTGVTTREILRALEGDGVVVGADASTEMLTRAKEKITAANASFVEAKAENIDVVVDDSFDRVVCNSAFWQFDVVSVLESIHTVLRGEGRLVFNLPDQYYRGNVDDPRLVDRMQRIAVEEGLLPVERYLTRDTVEHVLTETGLTLLDVEEQVLEKSLSEIYTFLQIPMMTTWLQPLSYEQRMDVLEEAYAEVDGSDTVTSTWTYFTAEP